MFYTPVVGQSEVCGGGWGVGDGGVGVEGK